MSTCDEEEEVEGEDEEVKEEEMEVEGEEEPVEMEELVMVRLQHKVYFLF